MLVSEALKTRRQEREALLERIVTRIREDKRIVAAWLTGSLGREQGDDLSDIDLWIAVSDNYSRFVVSGRREFVQRVEAPLLIKEAPQNAPQDGGYLLTLYSGACGPHQVDWYWQPQGKAVLPIEAKVLFDLVGIPQEAAAEISAAERASMVTDRVAFFWAMSAIAAKKVARKQLWVALSIIAMVQNTLTEVRQYLGRTGLPEAQPYTPPCSPEEQLQLLCKLAQEMQTLNPELLRMGSDTSEMAAGQVMCYFDLVATLLNEPQQNGESK